MSSNIQQVGQQMPDSALNRPTFCVLGTGVLVFCNCKRKPKMTTTTPDTLLRVPQVLQRLPIGRANWLAGVRTGKYPPGHLLSPRVRVWKSSEIDRLINAL